MDAASAPVHGLTASLHIWIAEPTGGEMNVAIQRSPVLAALALISLKVSPVLSDDSQKLVGGEALTLVVDAVVEA